MKIGAVFPQTEVEPDPATVRRYVEAVESADFDYLAIYDHVLGASPDRPNWSGPYTIDHPFHEVMVLYGYIAAITTRLELVTEILVLPQRQTALVAKQAAEIDILSGGRLRLGVGIGWNRVEYEALGMNFRDRGKRLEEQISVIRKLWSDPEVTVHGPHHTIAAAGLRPLPGRRIPIWIGATADVGLRRAARIADGWQSELGIGPEAEANVGRLKQYLAEERRDIASFGIAGEVGLGRDGIEQATRDIEAWKALGATHVSVTTMGQGFGGADDHIRALTSFKRARDRRSGASSTS